MEVNLWTKRDFKNLLLALTSCSFLLKNSAVERLLQEYLVKTTWGDQEWREFGCTILFRFSPSNWFTM